MNTEQKHTNICITKRGDSLFYKTILIVKYLGSVLWDVWKYVTWKTGRHITESARYWSQDFEEMCVHDEQKLVS